MLVWTLAFLIGCCSILLIPAFPDAPILFVSLALIALLGVWSTFKAILTKAVCLRKIQLLILGGCCAGVVWSCNHAYWQLQGQIPEPFNNQAHIIDAEVIELPAIYPDYCQLVVKVINADAPVLIDKRLRLKLYQQPCSFRLGELWQMTAKLKPIHGPVNQAGFDLERWYFQERLDGRGYIKAEGLQRLAVAEGLVHGLRQGVRDQLASLAQAGVFEALLIGERSKLTANHNEVLRKLGLSHLIAISGLHISIIAGSSLWLMSCVWGLLVHLSWARKIAPLQAGIVSSCLVALCYSALADFALPTLRALIMWCCVSAAVLLQRRAAFYEGIVLSLLIILVLFPLSVMSPSFWMTFLAVLVIALCLAGRVNRPKGALSFIKQLVYLQFAITATLAIPALIFFQQASWFGVIANLIMIPLFSLMLLPLIMVSFIIHLIGFSLPLEWLDSGIGHFFGYFDMLLTAQEGNGLVAPAFSLYLNITLALFMGFILLIALLPIGRIKYPLVAAALVVTGLSHYSDKQNYDQNAPASWRIEIFDVGHGLSILLHNNQDAILYDTGYASPGSSAVSSYIIPSLRALGISQFDILILSHKDNDHAGGANELLDNFPVTTVIADSWYDNPGQPCAIGQSIELNGAKLEFLYGEQNAVSSKANNQSCVVKISIDDFSMLIPGDIEKDAEYLLAGSDDHSKLQSDLLIAPHHGSKTSSTYPFIKRVNPAIVIYTSELYSRYPIPHPSVQQRYQELNIEAEHTGCAGQISIDPYQRTLKRWRAEQKLWRKKACEF